MQKSRILSDHKVKSLFNELNNFFYKQNSVNVSIDVAMKHNNYTNFQRDIYAAMAFQVSSFNTEENISNVVDTIKKIDSEDVQNIIAISSIFTFIDNSSARGFFEWAAILGGIYALSMMNAQNLEFYIGADSSKLIDKRISFFTNQIDQTTRKIIYNFILDGNKKGMNIQEIMNYIEINMIDVLSERSNLIAETELVNMFNTFAYETYLQNGAKKHRWVTTVDERTCPICSKNENVGFIPITENFPSGNKYPPAHLRCRCYIIPDSSVSGRVWRG